MLNRHGQIRAGVKSHQGKIHTKALSTRGAENFLQAGKARQNHLGGRVALTKGFIVTGVPVGYRGIHAAARLGQGRLISFH
jgi:hypothetical protein